MTWMTLNTWINHEFELNLTTWMKVNHVNETPHMDDIVPQG